MSRAAWILALLVAAGSCAAQVVADAPSPSRRAEDPLVPGPSRSFYGLDLRYQSTGQYGRDVVSQLHVRSYVEPQSEEFVWNGLFQIENHADTTGESVALTARCFKYGAAPCWTAVQEMHCLSGDFSHGWCWVRESDFVGEGGQLNYGAVDLIVVGKSRKAVNAGPAGVYAIDVVTPQGGRDRAGDTYLLYGRKYEIDCVKSCLELRPRSRINFDAGGDDASQLFDERTGYLGFWNHQREVFAVNMTHGGLRVAEVPCPKSVPGTPRGCVRVNETGFVPVYRE